jgi:hypothetical protein
VAEAEEPGSMLWKGWLDDVSELFKTVCDWRANDWNNEAEEERAMNNLQIVSIGCIPIAEILSVLDQTFGSGHDETWFAWKHVDSPWGPSFGWVAIDYTGVVGVRLFMRWELVLNGRIIQAVRPVDTAVVPRARGRGVFRELTKFAIATVKEDPNVDLIFNTQTRTAIPGTHVWDGLYSARSRMACDLSCLGESPALKALMRHSVPLMMP